MIITNSFDENGKDFKDVIEYFLLQFFYEKMEIISEDFK